ncbi:MAG: VWA domain-containing protein [Planctomycetota bacterium]
MTFHPSSIWLLILLPLALMPFLRSWRRARFTVRFSSLDAVEHAPRGRMTRIRRILPFLRAGALACLVIALARPVIPSESARTSVEGVAIELVVDRSGSMKALDFSLNDRPANRLDALKDVATRFIKGGDGFAGRPNDLVGIVCFAGKADSLVPLTLDHDVAIEAMQQIDFPDDRQSSESGTAIGDAVALGVDKLKDASDRANRDGRTRIKSRVLVLLTDGESNAGELAPLEATALAQSTEVRIYAIGLGTKGFANVPVQTPFGTQLQRVPVSIDEKTLTEMATATGGRYFRATDSDSLRAIYETIDALEKSNIEESRQTRYSELAVASFNLDLPLLAPIEIPAVLVLAMILLTAETVLACTRLRSMA